MIELSQSEGCPHSGTVREKLSELGVSYVVHDPRLPGDHGGEVTTELTRDEQVTGGNDAIPYLVGTEHVVAVSESDDVVEHIDQHCE